MSWLKETPSKIPAPLAGLGLGLASLGAATQSLNPIAGNLTAGLAGLVLFIPPIKRLFQSGLVRLHLPLGDQLYRDVKAQRIYDR